MYPPNAKLTRLVDAAVEPLSVADAKIYLRVETTAEDSLIADEITAARLECENHLGQSFITTTWKYTLDFLPILASWTGSLGYSCDSVRGASDGSIVLPMPPLIALTSINYINVGGSSTLLDPSLYQISAGNPGKIFPPYGSFFPLSQPRPSAVDIIYTAGYGADATTTPKSIIQAMRLLVAHYHKHRTTNAPVPDAIVNLLNAASWGGYG